MSKHFRFRYSLLLGVMLVVSDGSGAAPTVAVTDFELNDITSLPNTPAERLRTETLKPLLEKALVNAEGYRIALVDSDAYDVANPGFGYLFQHHDSAATLGKRLGADWMVIGQHSKPSFLFSYLLVNLVDVATGKRIAEFAIELKGNHRNVTKRGIEKLARAINRAIRVYDKAG